MISEVQEVQWGCCYLRCFWGTSAAPEPGTLANSSLAAYYNKCVIRG
jgi:hypothetical protein